MTSSPPLTLLQARLAELASQVPHRRVGAPALPGHAGTVSMGGKQYLNLASWDVLGFRYDQLIRRRWLEAIEQEGFAPTNTRSNGGLSLAQAAAEDRVAKFFQRERAAIFPTKTQAVLALGRVLFGPGSWVFTERESLGPFSDAATIFDANHDTFSTEEPGTLERVVARSTGAGLRVVVLDSAQQRSGKDNNINYISKVCDSSGALLLVDESWSLGVGGIRGAGLAGGAGVAVIGDLSLVLGVPACLVAGGATLIEALNIALADAGVDHCLEAPLAARVIATLDVCEGALAARTLFTLRMSELSSGLNLPHFEAPFVTIPFQSQAKARAFVSEAAKNLFHVEHPLPSLRSVGTAVRIFPPFALTPDRCREVGSKLRALRERVAT